MNILDGMNFDEDGYFSKVLDLLDDPEWPAAVEDDQICQSPQEELERTLSVMEFCIGHNQLHRTKRLLDYGCGKQFFVEAAARFGIEIAIGYDIVPGENVTNDLETVEFYGPYDTIICHDVLDHLEGESMQEALQKMSNLLSKDGWLSIWFHPYCSRNGLHLHNQINKAYVHLLLDTHNLKYSAPYTIPIFAPSKTYKNAVQSTNLKVMHMMCYKREVESFFTQKKWFDELLIPQDELNICGVEYLLTKTDTTEVSHNPRFFDLATSVESSDS